MAPQLVAEIEYREMYDGLAYGACAYTIRFGQRGRSGSVARVRGLPGGQLNRTGLDAGIRHPPLLPGFGQIRITQEVA